MQVTIYDLGDAIKEEAGERLRWLEVFAQIYHIPMFVSMAVANTPKETIYSRAIYNAASHGISLADDRIREHMLIPSGFQPVPPRDVFAFDPLGVLETARRVGVTAYSIPADAREELAQGMQEFYGFCSMYHIPMFTTAALENREDGTDYYNSVYNAVSHDIGLTNDEIRKHLLIASGFHTIPGTKDDRHRTVEEVVGDG